MILLSTTSTEPFQNIFETDILNDLVKIDKEVSLDEIVNTVNFYLIVENEQGSIFDLIINYNKNITGIGLQISEDNINWYDKLSYIITDNDRHVIPIYLRYSILDNRYFIDRTLHYPDDIEDHYIQIDVENAENDNLIIEVEDDKCPDEYNAYLLVAQIDEDFNIISNFNKKIEIPIYTNDKYSFYFAYRWFISKRHFVYNLSFLFSIDAICSFASYKLVFDDRYNSFSAYDLKFDDKTLLFSSYMILYNERTNLFDAYLISNDERTNLFSSYDIVTDERTNSFDSYLLDNDERNLYFEGE